MAQPLVIAYHLIWTAYGTWLPNDPRGSGSKTVHCDVLAELGQLHFGRKRVQPAGWEVRQFYNRAKELLKFPLVAFDEPTRMVIASAFQQVIDTERYTCYACAIMPDHVHVLLRKHKHLAEQMIERLRETSRESSSLAGRFPAGHPIWTGGGGWKVFLDHPEEVQRTIQYIEKNPDAYRLPRQRWPFVMEYDGWPLHAGHSPNSPYARALRDVGRYP